MADLHDGSSTAIGARDKNRPQKRKGQFYQDTNKLPSSQLRNLSLPDDRSVPAAEPAPPIPGSWGQLPQLPQSFPIFITVRASSNPAHYPLNKFDPPVNGPYINLVRPGNYGVPNALEQATGFGHDSPRFGGKPTPFYDTGTRVCTLCSYLVVLNVIFILSRNITCLHDSMPLSNVPIDPFVSAIKSAHFTIVFFSFKH